MLSFILLLVCIVATVVTDVIGEPPSYLVGLLGTAAGAFFAALGSDAQKRDADTRDTAVDAKSTAGEAKSVAQRAESKVDSILEHEREHDSTAEIVAEPGEER